MAASRRQHVHRVAHPLARHVLAGVLVLAFISESARAQAPAAAEATQSRAFAAEIQAFLAADRVTPPAPCQVLFVGSSSMVKWKATLAADMAPLRVINRGFGGSTFTR